MDTSQTIVRLEEPGRILIKQKKILVSRNIGNQEKLVFLHKLWKFWYLCFSHIFDFSLEVFFPCEYYLSGSTAMQWQPLWYSTLWRT